MIISSLEEARPEDRDEIVSLIHRVVRHLNQIGIPQWDEVYPTAANVDEDIQKQELHVVRAEQAIAGIITLNRESDPAYQSADWQCIDGDYRVVHRLCVAPDMQGHGIGTKMMRMTEDMLRKRGVGSIRLDAFSQNPYSLRMYQKLGYQTTGKAVWRKGLFYLMEKDIAIGEQDK